MDHDADIHSKSWSPDSADNLEFSAERLSENANANSERGDQEQGSLFFVILVEPYL